MRVLVTGGGGYIGSLVSESLLNDGHEVIVVDRFLFGNNLGDLLGIKLISEDIRNIETDKFLEILKNVDAVMDLAAISNDPSGELNPISTISVNHLGRFRAAMLSKLAGVKKYILPSSCSIYGFNDDYVDENTKPNPLTTYAKANLAIERDVLQLNSPEFQVIIFRLATVYGLSVRRMRFDLVVNDITGQIFTKGFTTLTTGGRQWRPFIHVRDVYKGLKLALESDKDLGGTIFNLGSNAQNYQIIGIAREIFRALGKEEKYQWVGSPDSRSYRVRFNKIVRELGFSPDWDIQSGTKELWDALENKRIAYGDDRYITVRWYKHLMAEGTII
jgi:nucleoside-diphosphate-sugar epimerase